eukprot:gene12096-biopygen6421
MARAWRGHFLFPLGYNPTTPAHPTGALPHLPHSVGWRRARRRAQCGSTPARVGGAQGPAHALLQCVREKAID